MITDLPSQYVFFLVCCYKKGCTHELCQILTMDVTAKAEKKKIIQPPSIVLKRLLPKILSHEMSIRRS